MQFSLRRYIFYLHTHDVNKWQYVYCTFSAKQVKLVFFCATKGVNVPRSNCCWGVLQVTYICVLR